jgi:hypothetical protein
MAEALLKATEPAPAHDVSNELSNNKSDATAAQQKFVTELMKILSSKSKDQPDAKHDQSQEIASEWDTAAKLPVGEARKNAFNQISDEVAKDVATQVKAGVTDISGFIDGVNAKIESTGGFKAEPTASLPQKLAITHYRPLNETEQQESYADLQAKGMITTTDADGKAVTLMPEAPARFYDVKTGEFDKSATENDKLKKAWMASGRTEESYLDMVNRDVEAIENPTRQKLSALETDLRDVEGLDGGDFDRTRALAAMVSDRASADGSQHRLAIKNTSRGMQSDLHPGLYGDLVITDGDAVIAQAKF